MARRKKPFLPETDRFLLAKGPLLPGELPESEGTANSVTFDDADWNDWKWQISHSCSTISDLARLVDITSNPKEYVSLLDRYPFRVTPYYLSLVRHGDPKDPIGRQCIPVLKELREVSGMTADPFLERSRSPIHGIIHRYPDRALLISTNSCATLCRHCTRKNMLCSMSGLYETDGFTAALEYIRRTETIREIIVSGGDPLVLDDSVLDDWLSDLWSIPHVQVIRLATRTPVVLPMRITDSLCDILRKHRPIWLNTQFNHPAELTPASLSACARLIESGIPVSNQTVLLRGINDSAAILADLCNRLQQHLIRPYYVFRCDPVSGTAHYRTSKALARRLSSLLRKRVGGLSYPRFVEDTPGAEGKVPL